MASNISGVSAPSTEVFNKIAIRAQQEEKAYYAKLTASQERVFEQACQQVRTLRPNIDEGEAKLCPAPQEIHFTIHELWQELSMELLTNNIISENLLLGGDFAGHVLTDGTNEFGNIKGCLFLEVPDFAFVQQCVLKFITMKLRSAGFTPRTPWQNNILPKKYLTKCDHVAGQSQSQTSDTYGFGSFELKVRFTRESRDLVCISDGFFISMQDRLVHCLNGRSKLDREGFEKALHALRHRRAIIDNPLEVDDLVFHANRMMSLGYELNSAPTIFAEIFKKLEEEYPLSDPSSFQISLNTYFNNHIERRVESVAICHFVNFLPIFSHLYREGEAKGKIEGYVKMVSEAWQKTDITPQCLHRSLALLEQHPEDVVDLHAIMRGIFFLEWMKGNMELAAYAFPFAENAQTPRMLIRVGSEYISVKEPLIMMRSFLQSWRRLEEKYKSLKEYASFQELPKDLLGQNALELNAKNYEEAIKFFVENIENEPLSSVLAHQFQGRIPPHAFYFDITTHNPPSDPVVRTFIFQKMLLSHLRGYLQQFQKLNQKEFVELIQAAIGSIQDPSQQSFERYILSLISLLNSNHSLESDSNFGNVLKNTIINRVNSNRADLTTSSLLKRVLLADKKGFFEPSLRISLLDYMLNGIHSSLITPDNCVESSEIVSFIDSELKSNDEQIQKIAAIQIAIKSARALDLIKTITSLNLETPLELIQKVYESILVVSPKTDVKLSCDFVQLAISHPNPEVLKMGGRIAEVLSERKELAESADLFAGAAFQLLERNEVVTSTNILKNLDAHLPSTDLLHKKVEESFLKRMTATIVVGDSTAIACYQLFATALQQLKNASEKSKRLIALVAPINLETQFPLALKTFLAAMIPLNFTLAMNAYVKTKSKIFDMEFHLNFIEEMKKARLNPLIIDQAYLDLVQLGLKDDAILFEKFFEHFLGQNLSNHPLREKVSSCMQEMIKKSASIPSAYSGAVTWIAKVLKSGLMPADWPRFDPVCQHLLNSIPENFNRKTVARLAKRLLPFIGVESYDRFFEISIDRALPEFYVPLWTKIVRLPLSNETFYAKCEYLVQNCKDLNLIKEVCNATKDPRISLLYLQQCALRAEEEHADFVKRLLANVSQFPPNLATQAQLYIFQFVSKLSKQCTDENVLKEHVHFLQQAWNKMGSSMSVELKEKQDDFYKYLFDALLQSKDPSLIRNALSSNGRISRRTFLEIVEKITVLDANAYTSEVNAELQEHLKSSLVPGASFVDEELDALFRATEALQKKRHLRFQATAHRICWLFLSCIEHQRSKEGPSAKLVFDKEEHIKSIWKMIQKDHMHLADVDDKGEFQKLARLIKACFNNSQNLVTADIKGHLGEILKLKVDDAAQVKDLFQRIQTQIAVCATYGQAASGRALISMLAKRVSQRPFKYGSLLLECAKKADDWSLFPSFPPSTRHMLSEEIIKINRSKIELEAMVVEMLSESDIGRSLPSALQRLKFLFEIASLSNMKEVEILLPTTLKLHDMFFVECLSDGEEKQYKEFSKFFDAILGGVYAVSGSIECQRAYILLAQRVLMRMIAYPLFIHSHLVEIQQNPVNCELLSAALQKEHSLNQSGEPSISRFIEIMRLMRGGERAFGSDVLKIGRELFFENLELITNNLLISANAMIRDEFKNAIRAIVTFAKRTMEPSDLQAFVKRMSQVLRNKYDFEQFLKKALSD